jgi:signal transduction histidine kinase
VLTDVMMPGLDGFALLRELRRDPRTHAIPVVMLSARAGEESRIEGLDAGADEYLVKPFSARELVARVGAQLDRAAARKAEITEQIRARRQTEAARQAAEAASHAKDEFLAVLGHELRNPLGAIQNAISALRQLGVPTPEAGRLHAIIVRQAAHLSRLMDDLLDVSRVTAGKIALRRGVVDLAEVADRCVTALRQTGRLDGHRLEVRAERVVVDGDPARLEQVIGNLLDNALKYTPPGGHIGVRVGPEGGVAVLRVRDSGVGLAPEHLASIFEPFVQAHASLDRTEGGLGLGLALVRRLVELHGGTVIARSEGPGRGSEFEVRIPTLPTDAATADASAVSRPAVGPRRVLIVEDHVDARQGLRLLLELDGHSVEEAADGWEGLRRLLAWRPDVALVDVGLPGLDGYALARAARRSPECGPTRLVALTGYGQPDDRRRALEAGFDAHLVKPVTEAALADVLAGSRGASTAPREDPGGESPDERVDSRESRPSGP